MEPGLLEFIRTRVNSFIKWDLARFFHDNPHLADTAENIARYNGREPATIETELKEMSEAGVLNVINVSGLSVYTLTTDEHIRELLRKFVLACEDRQFRVKAIYHVIRGMH
jgi:hypothetical protein